MNRFLIFFFLVIVFYQSSAYAQEELELESEAPPKTATGNANVDFLITSINIFGFDLMNALSKEQEGNFAISPYSLSAALAMVYNGTSKSSQSQMNRVLRYQLKLNALNQSFDWLANRYALKRIESINDAAVSTVSSLWLQRGIEVLPDFEQAMRFNFLDAFKRTNFNTSLESSRIDINTWIKSKTKGRMPDLLQLKEIDSSTRMVSASAIFLRGKWKHPFDPKLTRQTAFFPDRDKTITVPMMTTTAVLRYVKTKEFSVIELPYSSHRKDVPKLSMLIVVPNSTFGLSEIMKKFQTETFTGILDDMKLSLVVASIPRFKINETLFLNSALQKIGMTDVFTNRADFSGMTKAPDLFLTKVVHKAVISINEAGTEAGIGIPGISRLITLENPLPAAGFLADHPFLFLVIDTATHMILYLGCVTFP